MLHKNNLTVRVSTSSLIESVRVNLRDHQAAVIVARAGFEKEAEQLLKEKLKLLRKGEAGRIYISLAGVDDHSKDYERVIGMLGMHKENIIEIGAEDYARYVEDDWDWKEGWLTSNSKYLSV